MKDDAQVTSASRGTTALVRLELGTPTRGVLHFPDGGTFTLDPPLAPDDDPDVAEGWWSDAARIAWELYSAGKDLVSAWGEGSGEPGGEGLVGDCTMDGKASGNAREGTMDITMHVQCRVKE